jgi:orotidine-5'-phosphate decarboxylase
MSETQSARHQEISSKDRIFVALDVPDAAAAREIVSEIGDGVGGFKVGLQLFAAAGPAFVRELAKSHRVFLDLKFHDIPNTVAMASVEAARLGVWMFNVHASGGREMMAHAREAVENFCNTEGVTRPKMLAVTALTSSDEATMKEIGVEASIDEQVVRLAKLTQAAGLDGIVASAKEVSLVRREITDRSFLIVTPGIRPISATIDDQKRVTTLAGALAARSDYVLIGRPITQAADRSAALKAILNESE